MTNIAGPPHTSLLATPSDCRSPHGKPREKAEFYKKRLFPVLLVPCLLTIIFSAFLLHAGEQQVTYGDVQPIFEAQCAFCHGGPNPPQKLDLSSHELILSPAERARVVPGHPDASELVRRVRGQARPTMPLNSALLPREQILLIEQWVARGARDAFGRPAALPAGARVRLHGILTGYWGLDGLPLTVTSATRIDDTPVVGQYVQVQGRLDSRGNVLAERIRGR